MIQGKKYYIYGYTGREGVRKQMWKNVSNWLTLEEEIQEFFVLFVQLFCNGKFFFKGSKFKRKVNKELKFPR